MEGLLVWAGDAELRRHSAGTRWKNGELLFHMVFGYMVVRHLLPLVKFFGPLPPWLNTAFARVLNAGTGPSDWVTYFGSRVTSRVYNRDRMIKKLQRTTAAHVEEPGGRVFFRDLIKVLLSGAVDQLVSARLSQGDRINDLAGPVHLGELMRWLVGEHVMEDMVRDDVMGEILTFSRPGSITVLLGHEVKSTRVVYLPFDKTGSLTVSGTGTSPVLRLAHATS